MLTFAQCANIAGLASHEMILGASPSRRHEALLVSYLLNLHRGPVAVREMIVSDLRGFLDLGARDCAGDLLLVLRLFLSQYPEARRAPRLGTRRRSLCPASWRAIIGGALTTR